MFFIRKPRTAKDVCKIINDFLAQRSHPVWGEQTKLWDILSAARGPDDEDILLKDATTAIIRHEAFPASSHVATSHGDCIYYAERRQKLMDTNHPSHFAMHAYKAFFSLGLTWNGVNKEE